MDKIEVLAIIMISIAVGLFVYYTITRVRTWYKHDYGYKYYLVSTTFTEQKEKVINVQMKALKIKSRKQSEAIKIFNNLTEYIKHTDKGAVQCTEWKELEYFK